MSSHGSRSSPATAAAARPKPSDLHDPPAPARRAIERAHRRVRLRPGRGGRPSRPRRCGRFRTAGTGRSRPARSRITRVVSRSPAGRDGSLKVRIMPVGFDQGSHSSRSRCATPRSIAPSRRCAVVPYAVQALGQLDRRRRRASAKLSDRRTSCAWGDAAVDMRAEDRTRRRSPCGTGRPAGVARAAHGRSRKPCSRLHLYPALTP